MRTIVVGDIHGCYRELLKLLGKVEFDRDTDRLISLGDLMDRGRQSYEVFDFFRHLKAEMGERCTIIRGNHEQMMMDAAGNPFERGLWKSNGATKTIRSFYEHKSRVYSYAGWFRANTVLYLEGEGFQCTHAGLENENLADNLPEVLLWDRTRIVRNDYDGRLTIIGHTPMRDPAWYAGDGKNVELLPERKRMTLPETGLICLDTGCVFGYRLTAMVIEGGEYWLDSVPWSRDQEE